MSEIILPRFFVFVFHAFSSRKISNSNVVSFPLQCGLISNELTSDSGRLRGFSSEPSLMHVQEIKFRFGMLRDSSIFLVDFSERYTPFGDFQSTGFTGFAGRWFFGENFVGLYVG